MALIIWFSFVFRAAITWCIFRSENNFVRRFRFLQPEAFRTKHMFGHACTVCMSIYESCLFLRHFEQIIAKHRFHLDIVILSLTCAAIAYAYCKNEHERAKVSKWCDWLQGCDAKKYIVATSVRLKCNLSRRHESLRNSRHRFTTNDTPFTQKIQYVASAVLCAALDPLGYTISVFIFSKL